MSPGTSSSEFVMPDGFDANRMSNNFIAVSPNLVVNEYNPRRPRYRSYTFFAVISSHFTKEIFDVILGATMCNYQEISMKNSNV